MGKIESFPTRKWLRYGLIALGGLLAVALVFGAGFAVGRWSASPFGTFSRVARVNASRSGHGAIGTIQAIQGQTITIQSRDGKIETILVSNETHFDKDFTKVSFADLKVNDQIVVLGSPNENGEINARLIGLVDPKFRFSSRNLPWLSGSK